MINWVLLGEEAALEIETTVLAKAWMCDLACYYRECQVSVKPRVGERGCVVMEVVVQADWRTGCWSLSGRTLFHTVGAISGFYSGPVRRALQFRQSPLVVLCGDYWQGWLTEEALSFFQGLYKGGPRSKERMDLD